MRGELQFRLEIPGEARAERQHDGKTTHEPLPVVVVVLALIVTYLVARDASGMKIMPGTHVYFGAQTINSVGHVVPIRLTTRDGSVLGISNVALMGSGFDVDAKACTSGRDSDQCMISVHFHPLIAGSQRAVLTINRRGSSGPQQVTLSGVGIPPAVGQKVLGPVSPPAVGPIVMSPSSGPFVGPNGVGPVSPPAVGPIVTPRHSGPSVGSNGAGPVSLPGPIVTPPSSGPFVGSNGGGSVSPLRPDYALLASPADITVVEGNRGTSTIMVRRQQGFRGEVQLSVTAAPDGVKTSFTPGGTADSTTLTVYIPPAPAGGAEFAPSVSPGQYRLFITGTSGGLARSTTVELTVNPGRRPDYALLASPAEITVAQGNRGTSTIMVRRQHGFRGEVQLSVSGAPGGVKASFTPSRTADTSTLTLYVPAAPAPSAEFAPLVNPGKYRLLITGTSGSLMHDTDVNLVVTQSSALPSRGMTHVEVKRNVILAPPSVPAGVSAGSKKQMRTPSGTDSRTASASRPAAQASQEKSRKDKQIPTESLRAKLPRPPQ